MWPGAGYELCVVWPGRIHLETTVRLPARSDRWAPYAAMLVPEDPETGRRRIDFTMEEFERLTNRIASTFDKA